MALDIIKPSDMAVMMPPGGSMPPKLPMNSNSLCTVYYLMKILGEVQETVNTMEIFNEGALGLKSLLESAKWRFEDLLITAWLRDANLFCYLEEWVASVQVTRDGQNF